MAVPFYRAYPLFLGFVILNVSFMLMVFVFPKFEQIFRDFKIQTPWITQITFDITETIGPWGAMLASLLLLGGLIQTLWSRWAGGGFGPTEGPAAWVLNRLPWVGAVRMDHSLGESLEFCAGAIDAGRPIEDSLAEAAPIAGNPIARRKLWSWANGLRRGETLTESARAAGMPRIVVGMLNTAVQTADVAEVFRFLGRYYASRFSRAMALLQGAFVPVVVFFMGSIVAWLALSIFLPMMSLIDVISPMKYRP
jgi:type II secretory pathway component PulF